MLGHHQQHEEERTNNQDDTAATNSSSSPPTTTTTTAEADETTTMLLPPMATVFVKVAIVGAGAAGLQCAHTLIRDHGLDPSDLILLEARDRVGGRIHTTTITTTTVEAIGHSSSETPQGAEADHGTTTENGGNAPPPHPHYHCSLVRDHGAAWVHGTGLPWGTPLEPTRARPGQRQQPLNPVVELLQRETDMFAQGDDGDDDETDVYQRHLNPVAKAGNPWLRPRTVLREHALLQLYVDGRALDHRDSADDRAIVEAALDQHFERLRHVHRIGSRMFERGQGLATATTSLQDAMDTVEEATTDKNKTDGNRRQRLISFSSNNNNNHDAAAADDDDDTMDNGDASAVTAALTPFYTHLLECWNGAAASDLPLCEFVRDNGDGGDGDDVVVDDAAYANEGDYEGAHCTLRRGMERALRPLLGDGVRGRVRLNQPVTRIALVTEGADDDDPAQFPNNNDGGGRASRNGGSITLSTAAGWTVHAQACVVTVPAGCLQEALRQPDALFEPALSEEKCEAIALTQMGTYKKVFLTFDRIFWPVEAPFFGLVRSVGSTTAKLDNQDNNSNNKSNNPLGNYLLLDNLWASDGIPSLEAILVGSAGAWATNQSDEAIQSAVLAFMSRAMGVTVEFLQESCQSCHVTRWEEDPYSRGAYSSMALGALERHKEELRRPEWGGRLMLAGEATISEYEGSVHAAILSGKSVAEKVSAALKAAATAAEVVAA